jgi:hypothetical protein
MRGMNKSAGLLGLGMLLACGNPAHEPKPDRDPMMGDLLEQQCDDGRKPQWCDALIEALQKDGSPQALAHARMIRAKECAQGDKKSCE